MDAGGVQVQHLPSNEDPTRQPWRNSSPNGDQGKQRRENGSKARPKAINVERAQSYNSRTILSGAVKTPKTPSRSSQQQQQTYVPPRAAPYAKSVPQPMNLSRSPPTSSASSPPQVAFPSNMSFGGDASLSNKQKSASSTKPTPKPLNLSKSSSQVQNFGRLPLTATFPKVTKAFVNLPQPPKTATFPKTSSGFPKDYRQTARISQPTPVAFVYGDQTYIQTVPESPRTRRLSATSAPFRFVTNYRQTELGPGTPVVVLSHPEDSDSQESSPPTPCFLPEGYSDMYDLCTIGGYDGEENDDGQFYYYYYDYPQEYVPQTPTRTNTSKDQRRRSVLSGTMKVHPDAIVPIRQPKGPDMAKNFATRIRRQAVSKLFAAAAERRSKSTADRRKSTMF
jgi:hypothetical protein